MVKVVWTGWGMEGVKGEGTAGATSNLDKVDSVAPSLVKVGPWVLCLTVVAPAVLSFVSFVAMVAVASVAELRVSLVVGGAVSVVVVLVVSMKDLIGSFVAKLGSGVLIGLDVRRIWRVGSVVLLEIFPVVGVTSDDLTAKRPIADLVLCTSLDTSGILGLATVGFASVGSRFL